MEQAESTLSGKSGVKWQHVVVIEASSKEVLYERVTLCHVMLNGKKTLKTHKMKKCEVSHSLPTEVARTLRQKIIKSILLFLFGRTKNCVQGSNIIIYKLRRNTSIYPLCVGLFSFDTK